VQASFDPIEILRVLVEHDVDMIVVGGVAGALAGSPVSTRDLDLVYDSSPENLDRLVHERVRLGILSALAVNKALSFTELKGLLRTTDGNLSVHARKLEEAGYVNCSKTFEKRLPRTEYHLTARGRRALQRYLDHMEALIHATRGT